jgi:Coenzyme PQQ synthesis protein D (PqqD)
MKLSEHVRSTHGQDGAVVLDILHDRIFRLNVVGSRMVELLQSGLTEPQISDAISRELSVDRDVVQRDLEEFLTHLRIHDLIEVRDPLRPAGL